MTDCGLLRAYFILFAYVVVNIKNSLEISCKNEDDMDVDWFINYKLPTIEDEESGSYLNTGIAYAYITSEIPTTWKLSSISVESEISMLGRTWRDFKDRMTEDGDFAYLFYNDDPPDKSAGRRAGHMKGYIAFDTYSGIWMIHSIPRFGEDDVYDYPRSGRMNGQIAICVTFPTTFLNYICNHLLYCQPNIYAYNITTVLKENLDIYAETLFTEKPFSIRKPDFLKESTLLSVGGEQFVAFAKDNQLRVDLYSEILAPKLHTDLIVETWRRGAGGNLNSSCDSDYSVVDVISMNVIVSDRMIGISFNSKEDHSKWAISADRSESWVCISDLNRMKSQERRGGGAICFRSKPVWEAFKNSITEKGKCPAKIII